MSQQTAAEYLHNKGVRENTLFRIVDGKGFYVMKEEMIPREDIEKAYPFARKVRPMSIRYKGENANRTKNYFD